MNTIYNRVAGLSCRPIALNLFPKNFASLISFLTSLYNKDPCGKYLIDGVNSLRFNFLDCKVKEILPQLLLAVTYATKI